MSQLADYFLNPFTPTDTPLFYSAVIISLILLISGIIIPVVLRRKPTRSQGLLLRLLRAWSLPFVAAGALWLILLALRYEGLAPFTIRLWQYLVLIPLLVWMYLLWRSQKKIQPKLTKQSTLEEHYDKYLPKAKRASR